MPETHERSAINEAIFQRAKAFILQRGLTTEEFADKVGYSRTTISKYLNRDYVTTVKVEAVLDRFFRMEDRTNTGSRFVPTAVSMAVLECCEYAFAQGKLVVIYGPPAIGKTSGVTEFIARKIKAGIKNLVFITANAITTPRSLIRRICQELGIPLTGCSPELLERIVDVLRRRPHLIIVDDASYLNVKALEAMRYVYDQTHCGVVFMGVESLMERIFVPGNSRLSDDLEQLYSRVDLQKFLPGTARAAELEKIARSSNLPEKLIAAVATKVKTPRELLKILERVKYLRELNPECPIGQLVERAQTEVFRAA